MQKGIHKELPVDSIQLDKTNPRIAKALAMYDGEPTPYQVHLAMGAGSDDAEAGGGVTFQKLRTSILSNQGIIQPIIVNVLADGQLVCIEGNTRLVLYQEFRKEKKPGHWGTIPAVVYRELSQTEIDAIRLQAHLVGPRQWDAYSKARYLWHLSNCEHMPYPQLVAYCGGSQKAVAESIQAYEDMEEYYRPLCDDNTFDPRRFSGFVELQRRDSKTHILEAGFTLDDFAEWIFEGKIDRLEDVRLIPKILKDEKAKKIFLRTKRGAAVEAAKVLDRPELKKTLKEASLAQLCDAVAEAVAAFPLTQVETLKNDPEGPLQALADLNESLTAFLGSIERYG